MSERIDTSTLYLVGFRIDPDIETPQMYTIYVDDDRPILCDNRPILFSRPELAQTALIRSNCGASMLGPAPSELYTVFDIANALYSINERDKDDCSDLLNVINAVLDFAKCARQPMSNTFLIQLSLLADHLTFHRHFARFLDEHSWDRRQIVDALYWTLGMILCASKIIAG
jgi:hypothetical protein